MVLYSAICCGGSRGVCRCRGAAFNGGAVMSADDKDDFYPLRPVTETTGRNVVSFGTRSLTDDDESREYIRRMAEIGHLSYSDLADLRIIYPGMSNPKTLNAF